MTAISLFVYLQNTLIISGVDKVNEMFRVHDND